MNSVEQLIKKKLAFALDEEKRRIATSLLIPEGFATPVMKPVKPVGTTPSNGQQPTNPAVLTQKKANKASQIQGMQQKLTALQGKAATAKDPAAMRQKLQLARQKMQVSQQELSQIK